MEAFANLSIPNDYKYLSPPNSKGVVEIFDKQAIERWTSLRVKLSDILVEIHETPDIKKTKVWGQYLEFEKMRNQIVHQKSIEDTDFYKKYLQSSIFTSCATPIEVIKFFYAALHEKNQTNPLWPWIVNMKASLPVSYNYDPGKFEVIGNIYEGEK